MSTLVQNTFKEIESAKSYLELEDYCKKLKKEIPDKYFLNEKKFPQIGFTISEQDILDLGKNFSLTKKITEEKHSPLEKLLLAILWKNGDFGKELHIIEGIIGNKSLVEKTTGHVFYQFGKRLNDPENQPIVDQHILRAFLYYKNPKDEILRMGQLQKKHAKDIERYVEWIKERTSTISGDKKEILFLIDKILFALGKYIKQ